MWGAIIALKDWMRALNGLCLGYFLITAGAWHQLAAQEPVPQNQITLDASILAGGLAYARRTSPTRLVGGGIGLGTEFDIRAVHGEKWGQMSAELLHLDLFTRLEPRGNWQYDLGLKAAADIHAQSVHGGSAAETEFGGFLGGYVAPMWSWRMLRVGPRLQAGVYWAPHPSFGIAIEPLTARLVFKF